MDDLIMLLTVAGCFGLVLLSERVFERLLPGRKGGA